MGVRTVNTMHTAVAFTVELHYHHHKQQRQQHNSSKSRLLVHQIQLMNLCVVVAVAFVTLSDILTSLSSRGGNGR